MQEALPTWLVLIRELGSFGVLVGGSFLFFWYVLPTATKMLSTAYEKQGELFQNSLKTIEQTFEREVTSTRETCSREITVTRDTFSRELAAIREASAREMESYRGSVRLNVLELSEAMRKMGELIQRTNDLITDHRRDQERLMERAQLERHEHPRLPG